MKPGYLRLRSTLLALEPAIDPTLPLLTDPITDVFGRAAGWRIPGRPPLEMRDQTLRVLLHHPAVTGHALSSVVASAGPSTLVIDEQVVGAGVSEKFTGLPGLQPVVRSGADVPSSVGAQERASAVVRDLYGLEFARLPVDAVAGARALYAAMVARPMVVFRNSAPAEGIPMTTLGSLLRSGRSADEPTSATWLSSAIVSLPATASCADGVDLTLRNRGSFQSALLVWSLDPLPGAAADATSPVERVDEFSTERTVPLRFEYPICGAGPITLLVHSSYWWDYRFDVSSAEWDISTAVE